MPDPLPSSPFGRDRRTAYDLPADESRPPARRRMRFVLVGLPLIAVFAAFGSIMWLAYVDATPGTASGEPPLIRAETSPIKISPEDPGGRAVADQGEVRKLIGDAEDLAAELDRILPPPEEPVTPAEMPEPAPPADGPEAADQEQDVAAAREPADATTDGQAGQTQTDAESASDTEAEASAALDALLAEVTEQPDGTTGASDRRPTEAGSEPPASQPATQETRPAARSETSNGAGSEVAAPTPPAPPTAAPRRQDLAARGAEEQPPATDGASTDAQPAPARAGPSEFPDLEVLSAPQGDQVAAANATYRIQLAAVRNESDARRAWDLFRDDLGEVIGGLEPVIERANTANGTFYRVQVGPFRDLAAAESVCEDLKQRNASCFVIRR